MKYTGKLFHFFGRLLICFPGLSMVHNYEQFRIAKQEL